MKNSKTITKKSLKEPKPKKEPKVKEFSIFDWLKCIIDTKPKWESFTPEQHKLFNNYMVNKFLSMNPNYIEIVNYVQGIPNLTSEKLYKIYSDLIPQNKRTYSPFIKAKSEKMSDVVEYISKYYNCSLREANDYLELFNSDEIKTILTAQGLDEKQIKKLINNVR